MLPPLSQSSKAQQTALLSVANMGHIGQEQLRQLEKSMEEMAMQPRPQPHFKKRLRRLRRALYMAVLTSGKGFTNG
jgi:hypothetical protein